MREVKEYLAEKWYHFSMRECQLHDVLTALDHVTGDVYDVYHIELNDYTIIFFGCKDEGCVEWALVYSIRNNECYIALPTPP